MRTLRATRNILITAAAAVLLAACTGTSETGPKPSTTTTSETPTTVELTGEEPPDATDEAAIGGWIGGEPDWYAESGEVLDADAALEVMPMGGADMEDVATTEAAMDDSGPAGLTGGSVDDNEEFEDYLRYREELLSAGVLVRDVDPTGRVVVRVTDANGYPVAGTEVTVSWVDDEAVLRTVADGTARFHPAAYGSTADSYEISASGSPPHSASPGSEVHLVTTDERPDMAQIDLDILFLLDSTGSMSDEIDQLKMTISEIASRVDDLPGDVSTRMGMVLYRDVDDTFLTAVYDFTDQIPQFSQELSKVVAMGGGDYPEALDEALAEAMAAPTWRPAESTIQLVFLVADAPPQVTRQVSVPYSESMTGAAERGIKIFPISSSGTDDQAEFVFRQLAQFTGARYVFLTYGAAGSATGPSTDIHEQEYESLSLDDLVVRIISEEIESLGTTATQ